MNNLLERQLKKNGLSVDSAELALDAWREFLSHISKAYDEADETRRRMDSTLDVTIAEMSRLNRELFDFKQNLDKVILVATLNESGVIQNVNSKYCSYTKSEPSDLVGKRLTEFWNEKFKMKIWDGLMIQLSRGHTTTLVVEKRTNDGFLYWTKTTLVPVFKNKALCLIYSFEIDVTAAKEAEIIVEKQRQKMIANEKMTSLGEMSGQIAHEINTPLGALSLMAESVISMIDDEQVDLVKVRKMLSEIVDSVENVSQIVKSFRDFSRDGNLDQMHAEKPQGLIEKTLILIQESLRRNSISLNVENRVSESSQIICKPILLRQAFLNLIKNSIDALAEQSIRWIKIICDEDQDFIYFRFRDSGGGISIEVQRKLFEPLFTTKPVGKGTGIGLSLSREIVEALNGKIYLNTECKNTEFVVEFRKNK